MGEVAARAVGGPGRIASTGSPPPLRAPPLAPLKALEMGEGKQTHSLRRLHMSLARRFDKVEWLVRASTSPLGLCLDAAWWGRVRLLVCRPEGRPCRQPSTLCPRAYLLPIALREATKTVPWVMYVRKDYHFHFAVRQGGPTMMPSGSHRQSSVARRFLRYLSALGAFLGESTNVPPPIRAQDRPENAPTISPGGVRKGLNLVAAQGVNRAAGAGRHGPDKRTRRFCGRLRQGSPISGRWAPRHGVVPGHVLTPRGPRRTRHGPFNRRQAIFAFPNWRPSSGIFPRSSGPWPPICDPLRHPGSGPDGYPSGSVAPTPRCSCPKTTPSGTLFAAALAAGWWSPVPFGRRGQKPVAFSTFRFMEIPSRLPRA